MKLILALVMITLLPISTVSFSENSLLAQNMRKKKRKKPKQNLGEPAVDQDTVENQIEDKVKEEIEGAFFPDWKPVNFDWGIRPILGLQYTKITSDTGDLDTVSSEAGLAAHVQGIPVVPGNKGFYISPSIGKAWGSMDSKVSGSTKTQSVKYNRTYGGSDFIFYAGFYRHTLGVIRGVKEFSTTGYDKVQTLGITNDFGFLVLNWASAHLTYSYLNAFSDQYSKPFMKEHDYWLHGRLFTSVLSMFLDAGPGFTSAEEFSVASGLHSKIADGNIQYLKAITGLHLFWKIGATGHAKYIVSSSEKNLGTYSQTILPDQELNQPRSLAMPEDSLSASAFFGIRNLVAGFGIGWQYNLQILNMSEKNGSEKVTTKDNGFVFTFTASL